MNTTSKQNSILTRIYVISVAADSVAKEMKVSALHTPNLSTDGYKKVSPNFTPLKKLNA